MFRRSKSTEPAPGSTAGSTAGSPAAATEGDGRPQGKGRPTPTRREAEAAAKARARKPRSRREQLAAQRAVRGESSQRIRQGIKDGDPRYLPARDQGPVRTFIRDFVDSRFTVMELMVPLLVVTLILGWSGNAYLMSMSSVMTMGILLLILVDLLLLRFRLGRELSRRFAGESTKGSTLYAAMRALQMRFMRLPKARVKIGQRLPDSYR